MICPYCKNETPTIFRYCQNCKADLEEYRSKRNKSLEGTGEEDLGSKHWLASCLLKLGPIGAIIIIFISLIWFFGGLIIESTLYFYPPFLFVIGISGFIGSITRIRKKKKLQEMKKSGEILD